MDGQRSRRRPARAAGRGWRWIIALLARPQVSDVAIQSFLTPESVLPGQAFVLSAWVQAPTDQESSTAQARRRNHFIRQQAGFRRTVTLISADARPTAA